jgi:N-acetylmuramoyl-L-alanine amidase
MRHAPRPNGSLRVVLDLTQPVRPKTFLLKPKASYGHRLVVDLYPVEATRKPRVAKSTKDIDRARDVVVAVDAGHGGEDPGASGSRYRTKEKQVTLEIARRLKRLIDAQPGMRAVLTRTGDYFIGLRKRMSLARKHKADLFLSIHADAFRDKRVRGSSVYVLSKRGASSEAARWLAEKENSSDLVGGVKLDDKDDVLASVLLDLSQSATRHASLSAASKVYRALGKVGKVHGRRVQQAGFMVLKSPDIPSLLVETGFISNPKEERNLRDPDYQERLAKAIVQGVEAFFHETPPPGTLLAEQQERVIKHVIAKGDTLSEIADRYQVSVASLRRENRIRSDNLIRVGQVLVIPGT